MNKRFIWVFFTFFLLGVLPNWVVMADGKKLTEKNVIPFEFRSQLSEAINGYFELENTIYKEDIKFSAAKASLLGKAFSEIKPDPLSEKQLTQWNKSLLVLQQATADLASQKDVKLQRSAFLTISNVLIDIVKNFGPLNYDTYLLHCPMALDSGGHWLSDSKDVVNPYLGESMAKCGTLIETFTQVTDSKK